MCACSERPLASELSASHLGGQRLFRVAVGWRGRLPYDSCYEQRMEFRCPDPMATVRAANVKATLDAFKLVPDVGRRLIERYQLKLDDLRPDKTVPCRIGLTRWRSCSAREAA